MKPRNNCGFESRAVAWAVGRQPMVEETHATKSAREAAAGPATGALAPPISDNRLSVDADPGANGAALIGWLLRGRIAELTRQSDDTVQRWLKRFLADGWRGLLEEPHTGRPTAITPAVEQFL